MHRFKKVHYIGGHASFQKGTLHGGRGGGGGGPGGGLPQVLVGTKNLKLNIREIFS